MPAREAHFGILDRPAHLQQSIALDGGLRYVVQRHATAVIALAQIHQPFIDGDARNPGGEARAALELVEMTVSFQKCLLSRVFGVLMVASDAQRQPVDALVAVFHQVLELRFAGFSRRRRRRPCTPLPARKIHRRDVRRMFDF